MKKYLALFLTLLTLALSGAGAAAYSVASEKRTVTLSLTTQEGDPGALKGLTLSTLTNMDTCFWRSHWALEGDGEGLPSDTTLTIDETRDLYYYAQPAPEERDTLDQATNGQMRHEDLGVYRDTLPSFHLQNNITEHNWSTHDDEVPEMLVGYLDSMSQLAEMEEGDTISIPVYPSETHYPLFSKISSMFTNDSAPDKAARTIADRFPIPVLEEEHLLLTVSHQLQDTDFAYTRLHVDYDPAYDYFPFHDYSVVTQDMVYFTFDDRTARGNTVDTSGIDLGYGIYSVPIQVGLTKPTEYMPQQYPLLEAFHADQLKNAYPFPAGTHCLHFQEGSAQHTLHLFTYEEGVGTFFNVLDTETLDTRYRLRLGGELTGRWALHSDPDGDLVLLEFNQEIILLTLREDGAYDLALRAPRGSGLLPDTSGDDHPSGYGQIHGIGDYQIYFPPDDGLSLEDTAFDLAYNGEKLALCTKEGGLRVYGPGQLLYSGSWTNSLLDHSACSLTRYRPVALTWGE